MEVFQFEKLMAWKKAKELTIAVNYAAASADFIPDNNIESSGRYIFLRFDVTESKIGVRISSAKLYLLELAYSLG